MTLLLALLLSVINLIVLGTFAVNAFQGVGHDFLFGIFFVAMALVGPIHAAKASTRRPDDSPRDGASIVRAVRGPLLGWGAVAFALGLMVLFVASA